MTRTWNDHIRLGGKRCFISYSGFEYAHKQGVLTIRQASNVNRAKRIYINNKHVTLEELASKFRINIDIIIFWRNKLWNNFSKKQKEECTAYHNYQFLNEINETVIKVQKYRPIVNGTIILSVSMPPKQTDLLDTFKYVTNIPTKIKESKQMNQQQRLARVKQKQREYCLNYGMPESLIERNIAFAVTKFYEEEDKHSEQLKKKRKALEFDIDMLNIRTSADKKNYEQYNELAKKYHKLFSEAERTRNKYAKIRTENLDLLANRQLELFEINNKLES